MCRHSRRLQWCRRQSKLYSTRAVEQHRLTPSFRRVHNLWMDRAFYNLDVHLADVSLAKLQHGPSRGVPLLILQLRVKQLLQQSGPSALTIVNRVLSSSAGRFVVTAIADEADTLHRLEKQCLKSTSPEDVANFGCQFHLPRAPIDFLSWLIDIDFSLYWLAVEGLERCFGRRASSRAALALHEDAVG